MKIKIFTYIEIFINILLGGFSIILIEGRNEFNILGWFLFIVAITSIAYTLVASENMNI